MDPISWLRPSLIGCSLVGLVTLVACHATPSDVPPIADEYAAARDQLLEELRAAGIGDARVLAAMARVPRHEFVRPQDRDRAYANQALPIAGGQTISQPYVVALMTQVLELRGDDRVLEVGTGSGYQAAVLTLLAREVYSIEIDPALAEAADRRLQDLGYRTVHVRAGDGFYGWPEAAPFDAIVVTAVAPKVPGRLVAQLKEGGRLVMPIGDGEHQRLIRGRKQQGQLATERLADVLFVPMTGAVRNAPQ